MATGYTCDVLTQTFPEFVLRIGRAFGACVTMRDTDMSVPIPEEFKPSTWHLEALEREKRELAKVQDMTHEAIKDTLICEHKRELHRWKKRLKEEQVLEAKYLEFIEKAKKWEPPTKDHVVVREFMLEQLTTSLKHDCGYYSDQTPPVMQSPKKWKADKIAALRSSIKYHTKENKKEVERVNGRNAWVQDFRRSIPNE